MNRQIVKLFGLILVLYALLFGFTSYWSVFDSSSLKANTANRRPLLEEQKIHRGSILADDGTVIARSTPQGKGNNKIYVRHYPLGSLFGNPIGYSFVDRGRVGTELAHNDELVGNKTEFLSVLDELQGHSQVGDTLTSSLDPQAQRTAVDGLAGRQGSVVAIVPSTGEVRAMVSIPEYDPNSVQSSTAFQRLNTQRSAPLFNRATQAGYPPGSTMKVVTATAALDSGDFTPNSVLSGRSPQTIDGVPLSNSGGEQFGDIDMTTALTNSVNTWWAQVGEKLGKDTMFQYMDRYGFDAKPRLDYPGFQLAASGVYDGNRLLNASDPIDIGRVAIGQERLRVTPLQMAEVAAAVANKGELMEPRLWSKLTDPDGRVTHLDPARQSRVMSEDTASELNDMMQKVVQEGTGTAAAVSGIDVAGKTGTAEISNGVNDAWFIGFAPANDPQIAISCVVEHTSGFGGPTCGPIFKAVAETILQGAPVANSEKGTMVDERYRLERKIGSGGMADVWLAEDTELDRNVAVKILHDRFAQDKEFVQRFQREAQAAAGLQHPNVVGVFDRGSFLDTYFIAMEYVDGPSLKDLVRGGMSVKDAIDFTRQILNGARFAHRKGIIHRDLKPQNVLIDDEGRARVADFGIARGGENSDITATGSVMGTAQYLSPEQAQGKPTTPRSDIYSIGVILYEALTGRVPFEGDSAVAVALKQVSEAPRRPSAINPNIPPALDAVVMRALAKDPEARFKDADAFLRALDAAERAPDAPRPQDTAAFAAVSPEGETDLPLDEEYDEPERRRRWRWFVLALLVAGVAALVAYALTRPSHQAVPDVIGKNVDQANQILDSKGFKVAIKSIPSAATRNQVVEQDPIPTDRGGGKAEEGSTVTLSVSSGPAIASVPVVANLTEADATKRLQNAGFKVNVIQQYSKSVPRSLVIGTSPPAGTQLSTVQPVTLQVSRGANTVAVPNVVGLDDQAALAALGNVGLSGTEVQRDSTEPQGKVLSQSPGAGKRVSRGSQVTIFASTGAITVPDVTGQPRKTAVTVLKKAGFTVAVTEADTTDPNQVGVVISEFPPAGSRGQRGDTVTISVGVSAPDHDDAMKVAVLGGGISSEHEVSLRSAASVAGGLREAGHETVEVTIDRDGGWSAEGEPVSFTPGGGLLGCDVAFPVLHGPGGEDGSVQGLLEVLDVPYAGSDVEASAVCMDKLVFKDLLARHGIPQVDYCRAGEPEWRAIASGFGRPVWVKPARLGSSVGIAPASGEEEIDRAVDRARKHDPRVIVEAPAPGKEVECSLLGNEEPIASPPGEIVTQGHDWYDYEAKYAEGGMELVVPAEISGDATNRLRALAREVFILCGCSGLARCDFFVDDDEVLVNELNTIPGFTETSVYGRLFEADGIAYPELCDRLVKLAIERYETARKYEF